MGGVEPTFERFHEFLLKNARVRYFAEWWDQYVEQAVVGADYDNYRQVLFLVGSLLRRLGRKDKDHEEDRQRERFMWTRMKEYLAAKKIKPSEALYICGADPRRQRRGGIRQRQPEALGHSAADQHHLAVRPDPVELRGHRLPIPLSAGDGDALRRELGQAPAGARR